LVGKPEGKRQRHKYVCNVKMDLRDTGWGVMDRINLDQDRNQWRTLVNIVINLQNP
jgi:hypothetical protein